MSIHWFLCEYPLIHRESINTFLGGESTHWWTEYPWLCVVSIHRDTTAPNAVWSRLTAAAWILSNGGRTASIHQMHDGLLFPKWWTRPKSIVKILIVCCLQRVRSTTPKALTTNEAEWKRYLFQRTWLFVSNRLAKIQFWTQKTKFTAVKRSCSLSHNKMACENESHRPKTWNRWIRDKYHYDQLPKTNLELNPPCSDSPDHI